MKTLETNLMLLSVAITFWPAIVPIAYLLWKKRLIKKKMAFWFFSALLGYTLMYGVPIFIATMLRNFVGIEKVSKAVESFAAYYWLVFAIVAAMFFMAPVISTYLLYKRKYSIVKKPG